MAIDKDLYNAAYQQYKRWNTEKLIDQAQIAHRLSAAEAWARYVDLVEFCWRLNPEQSQRQRAQTLHEWDRYYSQVRLFEARRQAHGKAT